MSARIQLTDEERRRFSEYCAQLSTEHDSVGEEALKFPSASGKAVATECRKKASAFAIVSGELDPENWESQEFHRG